MALFLKFLNAKPNTLQSILNTEKDKTDRQWSEFGLKDLVEENLSTYNECFSTYKEFIEESILELYDEVNKQFSEFTGFIMTIKGNFISGDLQDNNRLKEIIMSRGKAMKNSYRSEYTVIFIKRT